jgi:hypothetical protein
MDQRFRGDAWIESGRDERLCLCLGNYPLSELRALALDVPHLNHLLDHLRQVPRARG